MSSPKRMRGALLSGIVVLAAIWIAVTVPQRRSGEGVEPVNWDGSERSVQTERTAVTLPSGEAHGLRRESVPTNAETGVLTVSSRGLEQDEEQVIWLIRDAEGHSEIRFRLAMAGAAQAFALAPGFYRIEPGPFLCSRDAFEIAIDGEVQLSVVWMRELAVEVLHANGSLAAGVPVRFRGIPDAPPESGVEATTDTLGRCTISCLALPGRVLAGAPRVGFAHQLIPSETPEGSIVLWLESGPAPTRSLVLVDTTGAPMSDVTCTGNYGEALGVTGQDGAVVIPFNETRQSRLEVTLRGGGAFPSWCTLPSDDRPVTVPRSVPVEVTVRGVPTGTPVDVLVRIDWSGSANHANPTPVQAVRRVVGSEWAIACPEGMQTTIHVLGGNGQSGVATILPVVGAAQHLQVDLTPSPRLRLLFAHGAPSETEVETSLNPLGSSVLRVEAGELSVDLPISVSTRRVTVRAPGHVPRAFVPVEAAASGGSIDASLVEGHRVAFVVIDPLDGEPVADVRLDIDNRDRVWIGSDGKSGLQTMDPAWREKAPRMISVSTGPDGVGHSPALVPGNYSVSFRLHEEAFAWHGVGSGYSAPPTVVLIGADEHEVVVEMPRPRLVSIEAMDAATGRVLDTFQVVDVDEPTRRWTALSGALHLPIPSTTRNLRIQAPDYRAVTIAIPETVQRETVSLLRRTDANLQVTATAEIPLEGTRILLDVWSLEGRAQQGEPQLVETLPVTLGPAGRAEFQCHFNPAMMRMSARLGSRHDTLELQNNGRRFYWDGASDLALTLDVRDRQ